MRGRGENGVIEKRSEKRERKVISLSFCAENDPE